MRARTGDRTDLSGHSVNEDRPMARTETRPSFRLPWTAGTGESDEHDPEETQTPEMIETAAPAAAPADAEKSDVAPARRATKFMAELSLAMQAAAEHARSETMARFEVDAKAVVEELHASATNEVAALRRQADDDVAAIREWSKAEIARIREETEARVAARKTELDAEMEAHAATVEARAERVAAVVAVFEAEMTAFFERLNAEEDPTRIATMAETMPDPPSLDDVAASIVAASATASTRPAGAFPEPAGASRPIAEAEIDFAAAEAEAASFSGDLSALGDEDQDETQTGTADKATGDASAEPIAELDAAPNASDLKATTGVVVAGLVSVASIANFKRSLARIVGVWSIGVASGPDGEFVFTVSHDAGLQLLAAIVSMPGFESQITGESDGEIQISAKDRDAAD
jgi:hypothetical protein